MRTPASVIPMLQVSAWRDVPGLVHGFCSRRGGVSTGSYAEFNLSADVGDRPEAVGENWARLQATFPFLRFATMRQVHSATVARVSAAAAPPAADALLSDASGVAACVLTADCVPVLLVAPRRRVVAAVHAGWRGTLAGVAAAAVEALQHTFALPAADIHAALGPAIGGCCYEVDGAIVEALQRRWSCLEEGATAMDGGKARLDLRRVNTQILVHAGIAPAHISTVGGCTRCAATEYFSHRASPGATGRQVSFIGWRA